MVCFIKDKTVNVLKAIDIENLKKAIPEDELESFEETLNNWKKNPKRKLRDLVIELACFFPDIYEKKFDEVRAKAFLKSIKNKEVREGLYSWLIGSFCCPTDEMVRYIKRFEDFLEKNRLL